MNSQLLKMMIDDIPRLKMKGNYNVWTILCPFHTDFRRPELPQLLIDIRAQRFNCVGCGKKGDLEKLGDMLKKLDEIELAKKEAF